MIDTIRNMLVRVKRGFSSKPTPVAECPSCPSCGFATVPSRQDITFEVGDPEVRTEPLVRASITVNVPILQCTNPNCRLGLYGEGADEIIDPIRVSLESKALRK